ncbi:MAG: DNA polymerase/3'-5' exonuclease PolX, partial [Bradyrhizobiaceae bacterium]|nr:DNA polymerase/3'-5' exonuclease PolX [Bradyrhizobiaceae bacterium]
MFDQAAELLEIAGESPFRVRAYRRAARVIDGLPQSACNLLSTGRDLSELPGIGKDLAGKICKIVETGHFELLDGLKRQLPGDLGDMAALPGLGPKRVKLLYDKLKVRTLDDLRRVLRSGELAELRGFGPVSARKLAAALDKPREQKRFRLAAAEAEAEALTAYLRGSSRLDTAASGKARGSRGRIARIAVAGSLRRRRETVGDLDMLVTAKDGVAVGDRLVAYDSVAEVLAHGPTRTTVVLRSGMQVDVRAVPEESYGAALMYFTGSQAHNIALRGIAIARGWKLNEYGLFSGRRRVAGGTEEEVYAKLGLAFIPPEMREDRGEVALAQRGRVPRLVTLADMRGDLHVHSDWTDGTAPIEAMAQAARALGYAYIALTDHSRRVAMAHGLDPARVSRQIKEIDKINGRMEGITVLKGIEVDILKEGDLDLPDATLAKLDVVVASAHSFLDLPREAQTERFIRAVRNRHVSIVGHPSGRLIGSRAPCEIDMERVIAAAREHGCCLELNAQPDRLDLDDIHAHAAKAAGVRLAISTDSHSVDGFRNMRFGIDQARRAWLTTDDVINT